MRLIARGYTYREIAEDLVISVKTVETHRARIMEALGCRNASELLRIALRLHDRPCTAEPPGAPAFGPVAAWQVANVLSGILPPQGRAAGRVAYKTGTSYGHRDALAVGYDGRFVAGVWMGRPDGTPVPGAFGGDHAAPLLFDLFDALAARAVPLPPPPGAR